MKHIKTEKLNLFYKQSILNMLCKVDFEYPIGINYIGLCIEATDNNGKNIILSGEVKNKIIEKFYKKGDVDKISILNEDIIEIHYIYKL